MQEFLIGLSTNHSLFVYVFIAILACVEGPILSMLFGIILHFGYFSFIPIFASLMIGDLIGDITWYYIGYHFGYRFVNRFGKYFGIDSKSIAKVTAIFHHYNKHILFISKITNGFGFAIVTLMTAGMVRIKFGQYLAINVIGQFIWTGFLLSIGYFFGNLFTQVSSIAGKVSIAVLFILLIFAFNGYKKYLRNKAENMKLN